MAHLTTFEKRRQRVRTALRQRAGGRPRLSVHRSGRHIYAQLIDDAAGKTLAIVAHSPAVQSLIEFYNLAAWFGDPLVVAAQ